MSYKHDRLIFLTAIMALTCCIAGLKSGGENVKTDQQAAPNVWLYDMGSDKSPLWPGFARVTEQTAYTPERGHGWINPSNNLQAICNKRLDALAGDCVVGGRAPGSLSGPLHRVGMTFRLDVPDGDYKVWVLTGAMDNIWMLRYLILPHDLLIQGKVVARIEPKETDLFRCANYDWSKGDDMYEQFVAARFTWLSADAAVAGGKLEIGFQPGMDFPVCAIVVAGRQSESFVEEKLRRIDSLRRDAFYHLRGELTEEKKPDPAEASADERQRGYIVAAADCEDDMTPLSQPSPDASRTKVELFSAPGEQEQASFAVYGLRDLHDVKYEVTDLKSAKGKVIPASVVERGLVQFQPWGQKVDFGQYLTTKEALILPARPTFIGGGTCKRFWLTFRLPADAPEGMFEGKIQISASDAPPATIDLRLRVIPLRLATPPAERFFYFGTMYNYTSKAFLPGPKWDEKLHWENVRREVRFIKDNEFCRAELLHSGFVEKDGKVVDVDCSDTDKLMAIIREENAWPRDNMMICHASGFLRQCHGGWIQTNDKAKNSIIFPPTPEDRAKFSDAVKIIAKKAKAAGWPEAIFECGGEYQNYGEEMGKTFGVAAHTLFKEAGVSSALRGNGKADMIVIEKGLVDYPEPAWCLMRTEYLKTMKEKAKDGKLWGYAFAVSRFSGGWWCFKHNIVRLGIEAGISVTGEPGNLFEDETPPLGLPLSMTNFAPTVWLKRLVAGAGDYKYLYNLQQRINEARASKKGKAVKAAEAAQAYLDKKLADIPNGIDYEGDPKVPHDIGNDCWPKHDLDKYRWQIAEHIMAIDEALGKGAK